LKLQDALAAKIQSLKQVLGLEKRVKNAALDMLSVTELDATPLNTNSYQLQTILFDFCGAAQQTFAEKKRADKYRKGEERLFGRIKRLPVASVIPPAAEEAEPKEQFELIKVIGLEPEKLFGTLSKYKVQVSKMPKFSNVFDNYESFIPGLGGANATHLAIPGQLSAVGPGGAGSYTRQDGRNVISLNFNPYDLDTKQKKKIYESAIKEISDQRNVAVKQITSALREKQEQAIIRRAWVNIAKKDIPKAFRVY